MANTITEEEFYDAVRRDVRAHYGKTTPWLREAWALDRWRDVLVSEKSRIEADFAQRKAEIALLRQECLAEGDISKDRFFQAHAHYEEWKASALWVSKNYVLRLQECNRLRQQRAEGENENKRQGAWALVAWAARLIERTSEEGRNWHAEYDKRCALRNGD